MKTQFTAGPWKLSEYTSAIVGPDNELIISFHKEFKTKEEVAANIRLVSEAPKLFEALLAAEMEIVEYLEMLPKPHDCEKTLSLIRSSLERVRGNSNVKY